MSPLMRILSPTLALGEDSVDHATGGVSDEGFLLLLADPVVLVDPEQLVRLRRHAREEIALVARVLVDAAEPLRHHDFFHAGRLGDLLPVVERQGEGDGDLVAHHHAARLRLCRLPADEQGVVEGHHHAQQAERDGEAGNGQQGPPPVAKGVLQNQRQEFHETLLF